MTERSRRSNHRKFIQLTNEQESVSINYLTCSNCHALFEIGKRQLECAAELSFSECDLLADPGAFQKICRDLLSSFSNTSPQPPITKKNIATPKSTKKAPSLRKYKFKLRLARTANLCDNCYAREVELSNEPKDARQSPRDPRTLSSCYHVVTRYHGNKRHP
jgi:hypothetical protein